MAQVIAKKKKIDDWVDVPSKTEDDWKDVTSTPTQPIQEEAVIPPIKSNQQPITDFEKNNSSFLKSAWNELNKPSTDFFERQSNKSADIIDSPTRDRSPWEASIQGFKAGTAQGLGKILDSLTSPINLSAAVASGGASLSESAALPMAARGLSLVGKGLSAPVAIHGGSEVIRPDATLGERGMGLAELAGGAAGMMHTPSVKQPSIRQGKLGKIADNVIRPEEVPHDFNSGIDFTDTTEPRLTDVSGRDVAPAAINAENVRPEGPWGANKETIPDRRGYDSYESVLEKQGRGELNRRSSDVPPIKNEMTGHPDTVTIKKPSKELTATLRDEGYESAGVSSEGYPIMKLKSETPIESTVPIKTGMANDSTIQADVPIPEGEIPPKMSESLPDYIQRTKLDPAEAERIYNEYESGDVPELTSGVKHTDLQPTVGNDLKSALESSLSPQDSLRKPSAPVEPKANFAFHQDNFEGGSIPLYNIEAGEGHPMHRSTVSADTLKELGIEVPETPSFNPNERPNKPPSVDAIKATVPNDKIPAAIDKVSRQATVAKMSPNGPEKESTLRKILDLNRTLLTAFDLSPAGRQGRPLMHRKEWWTSLDDMFKAFGSEKAFNNINQSIKEHPSGYFESKVSSTTGKVGKSFAEDSGLHLGDGLNNQEEIFRSKWAEKVPGVRASNRAFTGFLNKLRSDTFANMVDLAKASGKSPETDKVLANQIADFVNIHTGRGNLGKLEPIAKELADVFFAPRLMAAKLQRYTQVLNPKFYATMDPQVRNETLKSLLATAGLGYALGEGARMLGAQVNDDPTNTDFRKIKIGNTRLDVFGGDQQYLVAAARMLSGKSTSSVTGKTTDLTAGRFGQKNRTTVAEDFFTQKLAPLPSFVWAWMKGRDFDGTSFEAKKALLDRTVPIVMQDLKDLATKDPNLAPQIKAILAAGAIGGAGVQTYGR